MIIVQPRLMAFMACLAFLLFHLSQRYDPQRAHSRVLHRCVMGLALLGVWNLLPFGHLGVNPISMLATGALGAPALGLLSVMSMLH